MQVGRSPLRQASAHAMVRRCAEPAGIKTKIGNHTLRATGITAYLKNGGTLEQANRPRIWPITAARARPTPMIAVVMRSTWMKWRRLGFSRHDTAVDGDLS